MTTAAGQKIMISMALDQLKASASRGDAAQIIQSCQLLQRSVAELARLDMSGNLAVIDLCRNAIGEAAQLVPPMGHRRKRSAEMDRRVKSAYGVRGR